MSEDELIGAIVSLFPSIGHRFVVFTGGEPGLQLTDSLLSRLHNESHCIAIETNGSVTLPSFVFTRSVWLTVSPKQKKIVQDKCSELKLIYPAFDPADFDHVKHLYRYLQPLDDANRERNTREAIAYVKANPSWKLSLQTHKFAGIE